ncbi:MAG: VWA domain-containing protein [Peptococcaceae bacterium]|nr:VWA domain-containing protein [Peptococcaceae bacterium]
MEIINPWALILGFPVLAAIVIFVFVVKGKTRQDYTYGVKSANTQFVKSLPYYQKVLRRYKVLTWTLMGLCVAGLCFSLLLIARPAKTENVTLARGSRDIFLCMDVSASLLEVNGQIVDHMKEVVEGLQGDRFGIMIFNTAPILLVPLTDDYDYILETLEDLKKSFGSFWQNDGEYYHFVGDPNSYYLMGGVSHANDERGSSLIGDGLAACIFSFSNLEEKRSRIIIFSTDNQLEGNPLITLPQAAAIAKKKGITVYGIAPNNLGSEDPLQKTEFQDAVDETGGKLYIDSPDTKISYIIKEIDKKEKNVRIIYSQLKLVDKPKTAFFGLTLTLFLFFAANKKVKL